MTSLRFCRIAAFASTLLLALLLHGAAMAADDVAAIATPGKGDLTMCPYMGCNLYHHIVLPPRIAVGDKVRLRFGSNPKHYDFPVARILRGGDGCTVFSQAAKTEGVEKIEIASCAPAPGAK